jgi:uridine kinase
MAVEAFTSVSTWRQPMPQPTSQVRATLIESVARSIAEINRGRLRVAVDGRTASGKTSFGHELAAALRELGRPTLRASLDDFKKPWKDAASYDRKLANGYYRNAWDFDQVEALLLEPAGAHGSGIVALCSIDPRTQINHQRVVVEAPQDSVLIVDGVFAFRKEYNRFWDFRIWLEIAEELSLGRALERDGETAGVAEAATLHRERYAPSEDIYIGEVNPQALAHYVVDNSDLANPRRLH